MTHTQALEICKKEVFGGDQMKKLLLLAVLLTTGAVEMKYYGHCANGEWVCPVCEESITTHDCSGWHKRSAEYDEREKKWVEWWETKNK